MLIIISSLIAVYSSFCNSSCRCEADEGRWVRFLVGLSCKNFSIFSLLFFLCFCPKNPTFHPPLQIVKNQKEIVFEVIVCDSGARGMHQRMDFVRLNKPKCRLDKNESNPDVLKFELHHFACRMILGYAYPAYECYKSVEMNKPEIERLRFWCQYWFVTPRAF